MLFTQRAWERSGFLFLGSTNNAYNKSNINQHSAFKISTIRICLPLKPWKSHYLVVADSRIAEQHLKYSWVQATPISIDPHSKLQIKTSQQIQEFKCNHERLTTRRLWSLSKQESSSSPLLPALIVSITSATPCTDQMQSSTESVAQKPEWLSSRRVYNPGDYEFL